MAVLIECMNVVVKCEPAARLYPGGMDGLEKDCPNKTFCSDGLVARVGFMSIIDARRYIVELQRYGLTYCLKDECVDIALVSVEHGFEHDCHWLCVDQHEKGYCFAWMAGKEPGEVAAPLNSDLEHYEKVNYLSEEEFKEKFELLGEEDGVCRYIDRHSGEIMYVGRTTSLDTEAKQGRVEALTNRAYELQGILASKDTAEDESSLEPILTEISSLAEEAELIADDSVPMSIYLCGFVHRIQKNWNEAEKWFQRFAQNHPYNPNVWRDLTLTQGMQKKFDDAFSSALRAYELAPENPGSLGNLARSYMELGQLDEAQKFIKRAISAEPQNEINQYIQGMIAERLVEKNGKDMPALR